MATNRNYNDNFENNINVSLEAEEIAKELIEQLTLDSLVSVRNEPEFYHVGDLLNQDGESYDVKDDGIIHSTGNVFCETKKHWKNGRTTDGWMLNSEYDYLVVLDRVDNNIYILDFNKLKEIYRTYGSPKYNIKMGDNRTDGYTLHLCKCRKYGALLYEAQYVYDEDWQCYGITEWKCYNTVA